MYTTATIDVHLSLTAMLFREHESFDLYSVRIPEANESSMPISVTNNHIDKKGLGMTTAFTVCLGGTLN